MTDREAEHDKVFGYEELPGDVSIFDGDDSFDLLAGVPKWHDKPLHEPCALVNPIQDHSPSVDHTQEHGRKQIEDTMVKEWQFGIPHPKHYYMPKELVDLSLSLHGLTSNSAMRHIHLQLDASLALNSRHRLPLLIVAQLKNRLNTWSSVVEATDPNALPPLNAPYKVSMYPPCIANGSILDESTGCMEGTFFQNKKDSINALYWHIILHVSTPKRRMEWVLNLLGDQVRRGLHLSMHVFVVLKKGVGSNEIVVRYNQ